MLDMNTDLFIGLACGFTGGVIASLIYSAFTANEEMEFLRAELAMTKERLAQYVKASQARSAAATQDLRRCIHLQEIRRQVHERIANMMSV